MSSELGCCFAQFDAGTASSAAGLGHDGEDQVQCGDLSGCVGRGWSIQCPRLRHGKSPRAAQPVVHVPFVVVELHKTRRLADDFHIVAAIT